MELNVIEQCLNLYKTGALYVSRSAGCDDITRLVVMCFIGVVQRKRMEVKEKLGNDEEVYPRIHGLVFNPKDGLLKKLPVDFSKRVGPLDHIYGLYKQ